LSNWISVSAGPPVGGLLIGVLGATATMAVDAASFVGSAIGVRRIRRPEPAPSAPAATPHLGRDIAVGWRYILRHRGLRRLFWNSLLFGGSVMMTSPLMAVLMLRDLGLAPGSTGSPSACRAWAACWDHASPPRSPGGSGRAGSFC
jgi:hypothetical protein